jgi:two-component system OmpR family response regulator
MCVDDNRDVADSEADLLRLVGFEARACYSGEEALVQSLLFLPAVCLIDLNMPGMDGDELAVRLRELHHPPVVLVAVTAMTNEVCSQRVRDAGFDQHLIKPVDPHLLLTVVDDLWRAWEAKTNPRFPELAEVPESE